MINGLLVGFALFCCWRVSTLVLSRWARDWSLMQSQARSLAERAPEARGNVWGAFIGAILLATIGNAMNILRIQAEWQYVVKGIIIIVAVSAGAISAIRERS